MIAITIIILSEIWSLTGGGNEVLALYVLEDPCNVFVVVQWSGRCGGEGEPASDGGATEQGDAPGR